MSEPVSALNGRSASGAAIVTELGLRGMITIRGDLSHVDVKNAVTGVTGVDFPGQRGVNSVGERGAAWMSPDEILILVPHAEAETVVATLTAALAGHHALVVNVSDARAMFRISGPGAREVIAKGAPVDMDPAHFAPGTIRRSRLGQIAAAFWVNGDDGSIDVICFRSVAQFVFDWLAMAAREGSLPGYFPDQ